MIEFATTTQLDEAAGKVRNYATPVPSVYHTLQQRHRDNKRRLLTNEVTIERNAKFYAASTV